MNGEQSLRMREEDASDSDTVEMSEQPLVSWISAPVDRRRETRRACEVPVTGRYGHHFISCVSEDISERGIYLRTSHAPPVGAFVQLGFGDDADASFIAEGHVRWVQTEPDGRVVGCGIALTSGITPTSLSH